MPVCCQNLRRLSTVEACCRQFTPDPGHSYISSSVCGRLTISPLDSINLHMSDPDEYFDDDLVLDEHDRAILDAEERKWLGEQQQRQKQQQQQQPTPLHTAEMMRTTIRRPIESDAFLPAAKVPKMLHRAGSDAPMEGQIDSEGTSVRASRRSSGSRARSRCLLPLLLLLSLFFHNSILLALLTACRYHRLAEKPTALKSCPRRADHHECMPLS